MNLRLANFTLFSDLSWLWRASYVGVGLTALGLVLLYKNQNYLLYIPNPPGLPRTPRDNPPGYQAPSQWTTSGSVLSSLPTSKAAQDSPSNAIHYEEEMLVTKDGVKIHVWVMLQPDHPSNNKYPTLIYFHGNAGNMGFRLPNAVHMFARSKLNIVMMDYRGYGSSSGEPNEEGLNLDADTVLEFVSKHPKLSSSPIFLFGRSLGGAVSVALAHRHPDLVAGIVLENTFLSISTMVDILMPWLSWIKKFVLRINWDSHLKIQQLTQPILFISGSSLHSRPSKKIY